MKYGRNERGHAGKISKTRAKDVTIELPMDANPPTID